jgi:hypothetical protein
MALAVAPQYAHADSQGGHQLYHVQSTVSSTRESGAGILGGTSREIRYGKSVYRFWDERLWQLYPVFLDGQVEYNIQLEGVMHVGGVGSTPREAMSSFREQFHTKFQQLFVKRPFEMDDVERKTWNEFRQLVDVEQYRKSLPVLTREYGQVVSNQAGRWSVRWESGSRSLVDLAKFPDEFASYKSGQPFEAYVERDQQTLDIVRIFSVARKRALNGSTQQERDAFAESLGSNKDLPATTLE